MPTPSDNVGMISIAKAQGGAALMKELLEAADQSRNDNGKVHHAELNAMLRAEGYKTGSVIVDSPRAVHAYARKISQSPQPSIKVTNKAVDQTLKAIEKAAAKDGDATTLSKDEFETLKPTAKALVKFADKYGETSLDALFF